MATNDLIFMVNRYNITRRLLACCIVIDKEYDSETPSVCHYLWTAKRARKKGLAATLLDELDVRNADDILPEAEAFWSKHFARVQAEVDENEKLLSAQAPTAKKARN